MNWEGRKVLVTGGASFIGSHLVDVLVERAASVRIVDDLSSGRMEHTRVIDAVKEVLHYTGHKAKIELRPEMPTGLYNRVADNSLARRLLGWEPEAKFMDGLHRAIDWYFAAKDRREVKAILDRMLTER